MQLDKKKIFVFGAAACILLGLIMALTKVFAASFMGFSQAGSLGDMDAGWVMAIIIILDLAAIAALLLPTFGILSEKASLLRLCAIAAAALSLILFIIAWIVAGGSDSVKALKEYGGSFGPTFSGWMLMIFHAAGAALAFLGGKE